MPHHLPAIVLHEVDLSRAWQGRAPFDPRAAWAAVQDYASALELTRTELDVFAFDTELRVTPRSQLRPHFVARVDGSAAVLPVAGPWHHGRLSPPGLRPAPEDLRLAALAMVRDGDDPTVWLSDAGGERM